MDVAIAHLCANDPAMGRVIEAVGPFTLKPRGHGFRMLVRSILSQQISMSRGALDSKAAGKAAGDHAIHSRNGLPD